MKKFYTDDFPIRQSQLPNTNANLKVAQLLETYLEEVGKDSSIPLGKFMALAELFTKFPRESDDSIYRAIDAFLRVMPLTIAFLAYETRGASLLPLIRHFWLKFVSLESLSEVLCFASKALDC